MNLSKLGDLPPKYLYLILLFLTSIPILQPIGLPVIPSSTSLAAYQAIENLPPDSVVIFDWSATAGYGPELETQCVVLLRHLLSRPLKVVILSFAAEGPMLYDMALEGSSISGRPVNPEEYGAVYGEDYVWLGFISGGESAMVSFARDPWMTHEDAYGTPLEDIPMMEYCKEVSDWDLTISVAGANFEELIAQWNSAYGVQIIMGGPGVSCPRLFPYYASKQIVSILSSITAAAEYEVLIDEFGVGRELMDVLSIAQMLIVLSIIIGNIAYLSKRLEGEK